MISDQILNALKGLYPYFAVIALAGILLRVHEKRWRREESILLAVVLGHFALLLLQASFADDWYVSRRYLLPAAPLLFGWAGYLIYRIYLRLPRLTMFAAAAAAVILLFDAARPSLECYFRPSKSEERVMVQTLGAVIREDYRGPAWFEPQLWWNDYRSPKLPAVYSESPPLGYASGGRHVQWSALEKVPPDYWVETDGRAPEPEEFELLGCYRIGEETYSVWKRRSE